MLSLITTFRNVPTRLWATRLWIVACIIGRYCDRFLSQRRLNIHHRGAINCFNRADSQSISYDSADRHWVKPKRVWTIGGTRCKNSCQWTIWIRARMDLQYLAIRLMQPGYHDDLVTSVKAIERFPRKSVHFK